MSAIVINDLHCGVSRSAGTTPHTQLMLRAYLIGGLGRLLQLAQGKDVILNGDLLDTGNIPLQDVRYILAALAQFLRDNPNSRIWSAVGNHDLTKHSNILSSMQFINSMLQSLFPDRFFPVEAPTMTPYGYIIPHLPNQDLFDKALAEVPTCKLAFLHCNLDNNFAVNSDQSLNITADQVKAMPADKIILAHEHHARVVGKVIITGNQFASSVADWQQDIDRGCVEVTEAGEVTYHTTQVKSESYIEMAWDELKVTDHQFVKVTGRVGAADAGRAISAINTLRRQSGAFVIANGVQVVTETSKMDVVAESIEQVRTFDVWTALEPLFTKEEFALLKRVHGEAHA